MPQPTRIFERKSLTSPWRGSLQDFEQIVVKAFELAERKLATPTFLAEVELSDGKQTASTLHELAQASQDVSPDQVDAVRAFVGADEGTQIVIAATRDKGTSTVVSSPDELFVEGTSRILKEHAERHSVPEFRAELEPMTLARWTSALLTVGVTSGTLWFIASSVLDPAFGSIGLFEVGFAVVFGIFALGLAVAGLALSFGGRGIRNPPLALVTEGAPPLPEQREDLGTRIKNWLDKRPLISYPVALIVGAVVPVVIEKLIT